VNKLDNKVRMPIELMLFFTSWVRGIVRLTPLGRGVMIREREREREALRSAQHGNLAL